MLVSGAMPKEKGRRERRERKRRLV